MEYLGEFLTVAVIHLLAVASPGPDFTMVLRQSLTAGRRAAIWTSIGIGLGILVHVAYALLGLGLIISQSLRAKPEKSTSAAEAAEPARNYLPSQALRIGFLTNVLNPKATLFFLSLFSVIIKPDTPQGVQLVYGLYMSIATGIWFCGLSLVLTQPRVQRGFSRFGHWVERSMGVVLIALGIRLAFASR